MKDCRSDVKLHNYSLTVMCLKFGIFLCFIYFFLLSLYLGEKCLLSYNALLISFRVLISFFIFVCTMMHNVYFRLFPPFQGSGLSLTWKKQTKQFHSSSTCADISMLMLNHCTRAPWWQKTQREWMQGIYFVQFYFRWKKTNLWF